MARTPAGAGTSTPSLKKSESTGGKQKTLHGFFARTPTPASAAATLPERPSPRKNSTARVHAKFGLKDSSQLTPAPSSDGPGLDIEEEGQDSNKASQHFPTTSLPSPVSPANGEGQTNGGTEDLTVRGTPSRRVQPLPHYVLSLD